jgi:NADH-quinone oxidoreductase subunit C
MTQGQPFLDRLKQRFGDKITGANLEAIDPWIETAPDALPDVCRYLRDEPELRFNFLSCVSGVDYFEGDPKKAAKVTWKPHVEVVYHLWSVPHRVSLVLKVILPRWKDDVPGELPEVPTVSGIWSTADWHEREVYDLSGVHFVGHPALRRILCPEDWVGHPLRKDYEMPLEYHGIRGR